MLCIYTCRRNEGNIFCVKFLVLIYNFIYQLFYAYIVLQIHCAKKSPKYIPNTMRNSSHWRQQNSIFYTLSIFLDCSDKYQQLLCSVHEEYLSLLWIVFCLIRILTAQRIYAWICWNQRKNAYFCIGNPPPHIGSQTNDSALFWFSELDCMSLPILSCFPIVFVLAPFVLQSEYHMPLFWKIIL